MVDTNVRSTAYCARWPAELGVHDFEHIVTCIRYLLAAQSERVKFGGVVSHEVTILCLLRLRNASPPPGTVERSIAVPRTRTMFETVLRCPNGMGCTRAVG
jgi:hypothetical protein